MVLEPPESLPTDARFVHLMRVPPTTTWSAATSLVVYHPSAELHLCKSVRQRLDLVRLENMHQMEYAALAPEARESVGAAPGPRGSQPVRGRAKLSSCPSGSRMWK